MTSSALPPVALERKVGWVEGRVRSHTATLPSYSPATTIWGCAGLRSMHITPHCVLLLCSGWEGFFRLTRLVFSIRADCRTVSLPVQADPAVVGLIIKAEGAVADPHQVAVV